MRWLVAMSCNNLFAIAFELICVWFTAALRDIPPYINPRIVTSRINRFP